MPKEKHTDRPRKGPSLISRRTMLAGLLGLGTGTALGLRSDEESPAVKRRPQKRPVAPKLPEYDERASKIELPEIDIKGKPISLEEAGLGLPDEIDREKLRSLFSKFQSDREALYKNLSNVKSIGERQKLIRNFFQYLMGDYLDYLLILRPKITNNPEEMIRTLNRLLMHENTWIESSHGIIPDTRRFAFYEVGDINRSLVKLAGETLSIPLVNLKNQKDLLENPDDYDSVMLGQYFSDDDYLVINEDGLARVINEQYKEILDLNKPVGEALMSIDSRVSYSDFQKNTVYHEIIHVVLEKIFGILHKSSLIKINESIDMDGYVVDSNSKITDTELHELTANSYGIMHSGKMAKVSLIYLLNAPYPSYRLAREVFIKELQGLMGFKSYDLRTLKQFITNVNDEDLHKIGKHIAILGMRLAEENRR